MVVVQSLLDHDYGEDNPEQVSHAKNVKDPLELEVGEACRILQPRCCPKESVFSKPTNLADPGPWPNNRHSRHDSEIDRAGNANEDVVYPYTTPRV